MSYQVFLSDPNRIDIWLFEVYAWNVATNTEVVLRFSSADYATLPTDTPANQRYDARVIKGFEKVSKMEGVGPAMVGLMPSRIGGSISVAQMYNDLDRGELDQLEGVSMSTYSFGGRRAIVRHGGFSKYVGGQLPYADFKVEFDGQCDGDPKGYEDRYEFKTATKDARFDAPIQPAHWWGLGWGLAFNGSSMKVQLGKIDAIDLSTTFTVEFPLYFETNPASEEVIFTHGQTDQDGYTVRFTTSGQIKLRTNQSGAHQDSASDPLTPYVYHWIVVTYNDGEVAMYDRGVSINPQTSGGPHVNPDTNAARDAFIAQDNSGTVFCGPILIPEFRIWNTYRTKDEVNETSLRALDPSEVTGNAALVLYLRMDEGTGADLADSSDTGATGISTDATWVHSMTGQHEMAGEWVPDPYGVIENWEPHQLENNQRIYAVSGIQIQGFFAVGDPDPVDGVVHVGPVCENGEYTIPLDTAYTSVFTFLAATTDPGKHDTCIVAGGSFMRLGSEPSGTITVNFYGAAPGGTYLDNGPDQIRYIVCNRGPNPLTDPTDLVTADFTALETACPQSIQHLWENGESIAEVVNFILRSIGAVSFFTIDEPGQLSLKRVVDPDTLSAPTITIHSNEIENLEILDRSKAIWRTVVLGRRNWTPMGTTEMLPTLLGSEREKFLRHEWRSKPAPQAGILTDYLDAQEQEIYTGLYSESDMSVEAVRVQQLFRKPDRAFRFLYKKRGLAIDRMSVIYLHIQAPTRYGSDDMQDILGTSATKRFYVLEISDDEPSGGTWITAQRPKP